MATASIRTDESVAEHSAERLICAVPQDKSILHRILVIASLSQSTVAVPTNAPIADDVQTTLKALRQLGVHIELSDAEIVIHGVGVRGLSTPDQPINCENSGTTARLLMGVLAGQSFDSTLIGDASLSRRPMQRLANILNDHLGAQIACSDEGTMPVRITGRELHDAHITLPVASAQMKSALLLAGLVAGGAVRIEEPAQSRDHTERMLSALGIDITREEGRAGIRKSSSIIAPNSFEYSVPGDLSSAAFFVVAAAILRLDVEIKNVGLNPTRTAFLDVLTDAGVPIFFSDVCEVHGERWGTISINARAAQSYKPIGIGADVFANLQDEIPILAVFAMFAGGTSSISGAAELRRKESDRIAALVENISKFGTPVREREDGLEIDGRTEFVPRQCQIDAFGDHRIAMAMAVAALRAPGEVTIPDASVVSISFPTFFAELTRIAAAAGKTITIT
ncbi:MAG: 3-phosphoshikimate 1-carboxyvinyltransferase [Bacteroidetes bacterium]|nr:3-phosphoshikimate 1-carboxyvinyltransferase [Bacteroidota bacterium]